LHTHLFVGFNGCYQEVIKPIHVVPAAAVIGFAYPDSIQDLVACDSSKTVGIYNASVSYDSLLYFRIIHEPTNDTVAHIAEFDTLYFKFDQPGDYSIQIGVYSKGEDCQNEVTRTFHVMDKNIKIDLPASLCLKNQIAAVDKSTYSKGSPISRSWSFQGALESSASYPALTNDTLKAQVIETGWNLVTLAVIVAIKSNSIGVGSPDAECEYVFEDSLFVEGTELKLKLDTNIACAGDTVLLTNLSTGTSAFQSIEWLLKDSSTVLNSTDSFKLAYDVPKTYVHSLVINSTFGCSDTLDSPELLVSIPILDYSASENVVCKGESVIFTNSSRGHELSNLWTIEGFNYLNIDASHTFVKVGTFDIKLLSTDRYGCQDSLTFPNYVRVAPFPKSEFSTLNINVNCPPFTIEFEDTSLTPAVEWEWKISDGGIGTSQNFLHTFVTAGKFDVEFTSTNKDGCTDALNKSNYITVVGPAATVAVSDTAICSPDSVKFNMVMTDVAYYVWDFNDGIIQSSALTSNSDSVSHIYSKAGLINPIFTVIDTADCVVVVPNIPAISVDSLNAEFEAQQLVSCNLDSLKLNNNSTSLFQSTFKWDFGNGNTWADSIGINKYTSPGDYDIKLMMKSSIGCEDTSTLSHTLHVGPSEKLTVTNDYFCVPTTTTLQLTYENSNFLLEDAFYTLESNKIKGDSISLAFTEAKLYSLSYEITYGDGNCKIDSTFTHVYFELPLAEFDFSPKNLSLQIPQIFFTNNSTNTTIWDWDFGDGKTQSLENPSHSYIEADKYTVQLIASNLGGCTDTAIIEIPMAPRDVIQLPNAFTPDGDGSNDEFGILFAGKIDLLSFKVLNRWGNLVFRTGDINEKWDGQYKGEPQNHGTYVYHVKGRNEMGEILEYKGNFSLIR
jgi:gliding motility-associated-like protein